VSSSSTPLKETDRLERGQKRPSRHIKDLSQRTYEKKAEIAETV